MLVGRYLELPVRADLAKKMVFVAGPRQVGKTTLARQILAATGGGLYLSWDNRDDRQAALGGLHRDHDCGMAVEDSSDRPTNLRFRIGISSYRTPSA